MSFLISFTNLLYLKSISPVTPQTTRYVTSRLPKVHCSISLGDTKSLPKFPQKQQKIERKAKMGQISLIKMKQNIFQINKNKTVIKVIKYIQIANQYINQHRQQKKKNNYEQITIAQKSLEQISMLKFTQQDETLKILVQSELNKGKLKWKQISQKFNISPTILIKRNPKQCRQRWYNSLTPHSQQNNSWDQQNDVALIQACKKHGHRWSKLAKQMNNTINQNRLKNHFYSTVRKLVRTINTILKSARKQFQQDILNDHITSTQIDHNTIRQINKLRSFKPKYLSKIFSLIDSKQQYKYQAKQNIQVQNIKSINDQILQYMQDFVTGQNIFTNKRILQLIVNVMKINRMIKTKYIRQVKMSLQDQSKIQLKYSQKKKNDRKINIIVKEKLQHKIIPNRKKKDEVIEQFRQQNKTLQKLITSSNTLKTKKGRQQKMDQSSLSSSSQPLQKNYYLNQSSSPSPISPLITRLKCKNQNIQTQKSIQHTIKSSYQQPIHQQSHHTNHWTSYNKKSQNQQTPLQYSQHYFQNLHLLQPTLNSSQQPSINFSGVINVFPATNYTRFPFNDLPIIEQPNKKIINSQQLQSKQLNESSKFHKYSSQSMSVKSEENQQIQSQSYALNFINTIPFASSTNKKVQPPQNLKQLFNPIFPQHKLSKSQGYFCFDQSNNNEINQTLQNPQNEISKSNPNIDASLLFGPFNPTSQVNPPLQNSRVFQGIFAPFSCDSNGEMGSNKSQKLKNSAFDLFPCLHPVPTNLFCPNIPMGSFLQNESQILRDNRNMQNSKAYSYHDYFNPRFNMFQSQPIVVQMHYYNQPSSEFNPSGSALCHSYSYGQLSQDNKSNKSKKKK